MILYLLTRKSECSWNEYDSAVVAAESESDAKTIHPDGVKVVSETPELGCGTWVVLSQVDATVVGMAAPFTKRGVICASFNAG